MTNPEHESRPPLGEPDQLHLVQGEGSDFGLTGPFFNRDFGPPVNLSEVIEEARLSPGPARIVRIVVSKTFDAALTADQAFQKQLSDSLHSAEHHYTHEVWPTYPKESANVDKLMELYDATETFENCTLLHTIRSLSQGSGIDPMIVKDAERIAQIMIVQETQPELLVAHDQDPVE